MIGIAVVITGFLLVIRGLVVSVRPTSKKHVLQIMRFDKKNSDQRGSTDSSDEWPSVGARERSSP